MKSEYWVPEECLFEHAADALDKNLGAAVLVTDIGNHYLMVNQNKYDILLKAVEKVIEADRMGYGTKAYPDILRDALKKIEELEK